MTRDEFAKRLPRLPQGYYWKVRESYDLDRALYVIKLVERRLLFDNTVGLEYGDTASHLLQCAIHLKNKLDSPSTNLVGVYQNDEDITCHGGCATGSCCAESGTSETVDDA